jgi:magnesium-transporting ATPase (P-type)
MSVIVKDLQAEDSYLLLTKGADSVIEKLLKKN